MDRDTLFRHLNELTKLEEFDAGVPFYGIPDLGKYPIANIKVPVLAMFGEKDDRMGFSDKESALKLEAAAKEAGINFTLKFWDAGHAFMNQSNTPMYVPEVAKLALVETSQFFTKQFE